MSDWRVSNRVYLELFLSCVAFSAQWVGRNHDAEEWEIYMVLVKLLMFMSLSFISIIGIKIVIYSWLGELTGIKYSESRMFEFRMFELKWNMEKNKFLFFYFSCFWKPIETILKCVKAKKKHISTMIKRTRK